MTNKGKGKSILIWVLVTIFTLSIAYYQRKTGPTHPKSGKVVIENEVIKYRLSRSHSGNDEEIIKIEVPNKEILGIYKYKRFKVDEDWIPVEMERDGDYLLITLPGQPMAGKLQYMASLVKGTRAYRLSEEFIVIRFTGTVPIVILVIHVILMFLAILFSTRTGVEAILKRPLTYKYAFITTILFLLGGLIFGPIVQDYAFGAFWTGWPFEQDLTDNKTLVAFIFWVIAVIRLRKNKNNRTWAIVAAIVLLAIYLIPHSMFGSELDYSSGEVITG